VESIPEHPVEKTIELIKQKTHEIIKKFNIDQEMLVGIGLSVPALVDNATHEIIFAPNLGWKKVNIANELNEQEAIYVENEAMCSAFSENWIGSCTDEKNFVCINMKSGIGSSIFANGNLYRGFCGSAGEIGHIMIDKNGPKCACGNYGCLETFVSAKRMAEKAKTMVRQGLITDLQYNDVDAITYQDIINAVEAGSESAKLILNEVAGYLALGIANIINTINPSKIVLGKELAKFEIVIDYLKGIVSSKALNYPASRTDIEVSGLGDDVSALGAAIIPFRKLFGYQI
jgi:predicted NBD/HSP70 family sugar kinase